MALLSDRDDELLDELRRLNQNLSSLDGGGGVGGTSFGGDSIDQSQTFHIEEGSPEDEARNGPTYATSGLTGVAVDNDEWHDISLGFRARTINLRFTGPIDVAFRDPNERGSWRVPLAPDESPFTIGGDTPVQASTLWIKRGDDAGEEESGEPVVPRLDFIAMR